jgi:putative membrane protein
MERPNASYLASVFAGFAASTISFAARGSGAGMSPQDFVTLATQVGMGEVELGKVALEKSSDPQVLQFAQRMIADHGQANEELVGIATKEGLAVPTIPGPATTAASKELESLSGAEFDSAYMNRMVEGNSAAVELFASAAWISDRVLAVFARRKLPIIKEHKTIAVRINAQLA